MSEIRKLVTQSSHYFVGQVFGLAAGFISFPILTRIFSVEDYGILSLVATTLFFASSVVKLGFPNSIVRFHADLKAKGQLNQLFWTTLVSTTVVTLCIGVFGAATLQLLKGRFLSDSMAEILFLCPTLLWTGASTDILTSFLRAEQKTVAYNILAILRRYGSLVLGIFFAFYVVGGLYGFFFGQIVAGCLTLLLLFRALSGNYAVREFSMDILKSSFAFGFPLIWAEFGHLILNYVDRYLIQFYMGAHSLGLYTAGYNLSTYVIEVLIYPINYALTPLYMNMLTHKGEAETKEFFTKVLRYFLLILAPVVFGFWAIGGEFLTILASKKYAEAVNILPYIIGGQAIYACTLILNNGLFIKKKTAIYNNTMIAACILNIALNVFLIPRYGIVGAAQATLISYIGYSIVITYFSFKEFSFRIDYIRIVKYFGAALVMFTTIRQFKLSSMPLNILSQVVAGAVLYIALVILLDKDLRSYAMNAGRAFLG